MMEHTSNARPKLMTSSSATDEISWRELNDQIDQCRLDSSDYGSGGDGGKGGRHGDNGSDEDEFNCLQIYMSYHNMGSIKICAKESSI